MSGSCLVQLDIIQETLSRHDAKGWAEINDISQVLLFIISKEDSIETSCFFLSPPHTVSHNFHTKLIMVSNQIHGLWNPEVQCHIHKGSPIIPILSRINPIPRIDTNFFKVHSNIVLPPIPRPS